MSSVRLEWTACNYGGSRVGWTCPTKGCGRRVAPSVDVFGDGSFWAISVPGHTNDDIAYLINGTTPILLTGDASHFAWAFKNGMSEAMPGRDRHTMRARAPRDDAG
jgi:glyoxylase-like metal-dependent hydrolase (beta-lactamase superfamily II)